MVIFFMYVFQFYVKQSYCFCYKKNNWIESWEEAIAFIKSIAFNSLLGLSLEMRLWCTTPHWPIGADGSGRKSFNIMLSFTEYKHKQTQNVDSNNHCYYVITIRKKKTDVGLMFIYRLSIEPSSDNLLCYNETVSNNVTSRFVMSVHADGVRLARY